MKTYHSCNNVMMKLNNGAPTSTGESGQSSPSLSKVEYIAYKLGCPISHIVDMDHMILPSEYLIL